MKNKTILAAAAAALALGIGIAVIPAVSNIAPTEKAEAILGGPYASP